MCGETMRPDSRDEIEVKNVGATHPATNGTMMAIVARTTMRKSTMSAGIGITVPPTVNAITIDYTSTIGEEEEEEIGDTAGHGIDLDHHDQTESIIIVTVPHTAQPDLPHPQAQSAMGAIARSREQTEIRPHVILRPTTMRTEKGEPRLQTQTQIL